MTLDEVSAAVSRIKISAIPIRFYIDTASVSVMVKTSAYAKKHVLCLLAAKLHTNSMENGAPTDVRMMEYLWKSDTEAIVVETAQYLARKLVEHEVLEQFCYRQPEGEVLHPFNPHVVKPLVY